MPGRPFLFLTVVFGLLSGAAFIVGAARVAWWSAGSVPTAPMLPFVAGAGFLAATALSAARFRHGRGVAESAGGTMRAGFLAPAVALVAAALLPDAPDLASVGRLQWFVAATGVLIGLGVLTVPRLLAGGFVDRFIDALAPFGSLVAGPDGAMPERDPGLRFGRFLLFGALAAALVNAAIPSPLVSQPVRPHDEPTLSHLIATEQAHLANNYLLYAQLRDLGPGATIIVPPGAILAPYTLEGLSLLDVRTEQYDPSLHPDLVERLLGEIYASGETETELNDTRSYLIAVREAETAVLRLVLAQDTIVIVDDSAYRAAVGNE